MDALLGIVTAVSLGLTAAMAFVVWRLVQAERRRSDARVEALMQMAAGDGADTELELRPEVHADLFVEPHRTSPWGGRIAIAAGLAIAVIGIGMLMRRADVPGSPGTPVPAAAHSPVEAARGVSVETLELLSLHHAQEGATLTITGLVQNPRSGRRLEGITDTVFLFAPDGDFVGSGRAPLDFTRLAPGDESPFVVTIQVTGSVSRYRVGFRGSDGRVIGHVDRRSTSTTVARRQ
jgi:hypothetical protein